MEGTVGSLSLSRVGLGPRGSALRVFRIGLLAALVAALVVVLGRHAPWRLAGHPTLLPRPGQNRYDTIWVATWWAAVANALACGGLLATSRWWAVDRPGSWTPARRSGSFWVLVLGAALLAGALRTPTLGGSLSWDEAWTVRKTIVGQFLRPKGDRSHLQFVPAHWMETLFYYRAPTNHVGYAVAARESEAAWRALTGRERSDFDERALRLPALIAALLSVPLLALLVFDLGFPRAAPAAAFLLAIHPWHVRLGSEGRGYAFVLLFTTAGAWLLLRALRAGRWRDWIGYGACQFLLLWTHPLAVYVPLSFAAAASVALLARRRWLDWTHFVVANGIAGMAFLQLMLPCFVQVFGFQNLLEGSAGFSAPRVGTVWAMLASGLYRKVHPVEGGGPTFPTLDGIAALHPAANWIVFGLIPALALVGLVRALRRGDWAERAVVAGLVAAVPLCILHQALQGFLLIDRFVFYGLAALVPLVAIGAEGVLAALAARVPERPQRWLVPAGLALALAGFQLLVLPWTRTLLERREAPTREVADWLRAAAAREPGGVLRAAIGVAGRGPLAYDPELFLLKQPQKLTRICQRARDEGRTLYVVYGVDTLPRHGKLGILQDPLRFTPMQTFDGNVTAMRYWIVRYTGEPLGTGPLHRRVPPGSRRRAAGKRRSQS